MFKFFLYFSLIASWFWAKTVQAQAKLGGLNQTAGNAGYDLTKNSLTDFTGSAVNIVLSAIGIIFLILMIYAGFMWMLAQGNMEQVSKAKKLLIAGVIGLIIVVAAFVFTAFVGDKLSANLIK